MVSIEVESNAVWQESEGKNDMDCDDEPVAEEDTTNQKIPHESPIISPIISPMLAFFFNFGSSIVSVISSSVLDVLDISCNILFVVFVLFLFERKNRKFS